MRYVGPPSRGIDIRSTDQKLFDFFYGLAVLIVVLSLLTLFAAYPVLILLIPLGLLSGYGFLVACVQQPWLVLFCGGLFWWLVTH